MKRSFPPQKGNFSAFPLNNNIQRDSLASDPKKEERPRTVGNIYTHTPLLGRQLGRGWVIPNAELKERKHQLCGIFLGWQTRLENKGRLSAKARFFLIMQRAWNVRLLPQESGIRVLGEKPLPACCLPQTPAAHRRASWKAASCGCSRKMPPLGNRFHPMGQAAAARKMNFPMVWLEES